jgi:hypothetical protein
MDMPPEDELCLLLAPGQLSPLVREQALRLLAGPLDWPRVFERALGFEIFPSLYTGLQTLGFPGVPEAVRSEWTRIFRVHAIRTELLMQEFARILRLLSEAGVHVIPLKGVDLGESLYGDPALRVVADIDVLVPPRQANEAFRVLVSSGYQPESPQPRLLDLVVRYGKHCTLARQDRMRAYTLDLHCGLLWGGQLERELLEEVWSDAGRKSFRGVTCFALSAEWEFLYLAVHAARHGWLSLKWYVDLDRLCRRGGIDWKKAEEKARRLGLEVAVRSSLAACASLFDTPLEPAFGPTPPPLRYGVPGASDAQIPSENLFLLRLLKTPARKLRYLAIRLFAPTLADCEFLPLPASLFFLYYPLRPLRVTCKVANWFAQAGLKKLGRRFRRRAGNSQTSIASFGDGDPV